jgi:hypothetical protein
MKKILIALFLFPCTLMAQSIYTVSNVPGISSSFKTLQGAHDSVAAGSILYVLPSSFSYGNLIVTKKLSIYGTGFFLGQNLEPDVQAGTAPVLLNSIWFRPGSDNSYAEGLQFVSQFNISTQRLRLDTVSNITISRCFLKQPDWPSSSYFNLRGANNCMVKQCYIQCLSNFYGPSFISAPNPVNFSGIQFINNIIDYQAIGNNAFQMNNVGNGIYTGTANARFSNNTFVIQLKGAGFGNLDYTNNIFVNTGTDGPPNPASLLLGGANLNNITNAPQMFPVIGNNFQGANTDSMFVTGLPGYHSIDQKWMLRGNSFANTYGQSGIACGAYGNSNPYKLSGIPDLPLIYNLIVPSQATAPGFIGVHIKAKASN